MMLADRIDGEIGRLNEILRRRGGLHEDEAVMLSAYSNVKQWMAEDKAEAEAEAERIEIEAAAAAEVEAEERRRADPNYKTRKMFEGVKINVPKGR